MSIGIRSMLALLLAATVARGDGLIVGFEGDTLPGDPGSDWIVADPCEPDCLRRLEDGHFLLEWGVMGDAVNYHLWVAVPPGTPVPPIEPPPTLWVEWRFRSNQSKPATSSSCDSHLWVVYGSLSVLARVFEDVVVAQGIGDEGRRIDPGIFHTFRIESTDGANYKMSVDGVVFYSRFDTRGMGVADYIQFGGIGNCSGVRPQPVQNEWDFIRYGTLGDGEQIISADPPAGYLDPNVSSGLNRFTVTFDAPNYVYVDQITVETSDAEAPVVLKTQRLDNGDPDTVEIVLDRPLPVGEHTRFIFDDGTVQNIVDYSFVSGDADGNGVIDLRDAAGFQNCFGRASSSGVCLTFDQDVSSLIDAGDIDSFSTSLGGPVE